MQISSRLTIAIHMLVCIDTFKEQYKVTSGFMASSVNANPVIIRRLLQQLKSAGIVKIARGTGGAQIARPLNEITMLDLYRAVDCVEEGNLFHFHENPNQLCPVGRNIHRVLDCKLERIQKAMEDEMAGITMEEIMKDTRELLE